MHDKEGDAHQERLDQGRRASERTDDDQERASDFCEEGERQTGAAAEANRIRELAGHLREIIELGPTVQEQERQPEPQSQYKQANIGAARKKIELKEFTYLHLF